MDKKTRTPVAVLALSASAFVGLLMHEGYSEKAYIPVPGDVPTIGFSTTEGVKMGDRITPPKAAERALRDVNKFEGALKQCVRVPLYQHEYDAYIKVSYHIGASALCGSIIVKRLNAERYEDACEAILMWKFFTDASGRKIDCSTPGNKTCYGIWLRRLEERRQCLREE